MPEAPAVGSDMLTIFIWIIGALFTAISAMWFGYIWLIGRFAKREERVIDPLTASVGDMADALGDVHRTMDGVTEEMKKANQLERDKMLISNVQLNQRP